MGSSGVAGFIVVRPGVPRDFLGSLGSLGCTVRRGVHLVTLGSLEYVLRVVGFVRGRCVYCGTQSGSSGSSGVAGFIIMHPLCRRVRQVLLGSLGCALGVVEFIWGRLVHLDAPWVSSHSSALSGFIGVHPGGLRVRCVHWGAPSWSLGSSRFSVFIGVRRVSVHWGAPWWLSGADRFTPWESPRSSGFIGVRVGGRRVHMGSLECALGVVRFILCHWVHWGMHWGSSGVAQLIGV